MTAGRGIIPQEMPKGNRGKGLAGFQLWTNLPAREKMMEPRYREVRGADIPVVTRPGGTAVRVVAGEVDGVRGPIVMNSDHELRRAFDELQAGTFVKVR